MELKEIDAKRFDEYVFSSPKAHFMQTSAWGEVNEKRGYTIHLLGLFDRDELKGAALLLEKKILIYSSFYCPRGFITDYKDLPTVKEFILRLKDYVKKRRGLYFKIDPDLIIRKLDADGNAIETDEDNLSLISFFKENGGRHKGFTTNFIDTANPRFTFRVNVDKTPEELLDSFHSTTKKILKQNNPYRTVTVKNGDINDFYQPMKETALRKKMYLEPLSFFKDFYEVLHEHDMSDIYTTYIDIPSLKQYYRDKADRIDKEIAKLSDKPDGKKKENQLNEYYNQKRRLEKDLSQVGEIKEEKVILSSIITAKFKDKVWTIHGGNSDKLMFLNGNYELYYSILLDSMKQGYQVVDFFGSEGKVDPSSDIYGIYLFKLRFGGDFDEFSGEFDFVVRPVMNSLIQGLLKVYRRMRYKQSLKKG